MRKKNRVIAFLMAAICLTSTAACGDVKTENETPTMGEQDPGGADTKPTKPGESPEDAQPTKPEEISEDAQLTKPGEEDPNGEVALPTKVPLVTVSPVTYEAEDAALSGGVKTESSKNGFSGTGYVTKFEGDGDGCTFHIDITQEGFYDLEFVTASQGGHKENIVLVDGESLGTLVSESGDFEPSSFERVYLTVGAHEVTISKSWGWIMLDSLTVEGAEALPEDLYTVSAKLVNPNATDNTKRLMSYLTDIYGKQILSGQYCDSMYGLERAAIWRTTDHEYPAVLGLDMMEYSPSRVANGGTTQAVENAIDYWEQGGIVTFVWHWNAPEKYLTGTWYSGFYKENTNIDLKKIMDGEDTEGYDLILRDIDAIAEQLKRLQDAGVPVLWRPLHEASGGWFWWGNAGADAYKKLYLLLYDRLTNYHGLNNLIWVWNGQAADWYPGDEYVDIIGEDIYPGERVYTSQIKKFLEASEYTKERKMIVLSENGCLFDPDLAIRDGAMWGFFATWSGEFVLVNSGLNRLSEKYTEEEMVKKVYSHDAVITFSELPDLKNYPIHD